MKKHAINNFREKIRLTKEVLDCIPPHNYFLDFNELKNKKEED